MKPQPQQSTQEVLAGLVERVTYHNDENGFCVLRAKARGHRDLVTVIGHAAAIAAGEWITASGEYSMGPIWSIKLCFLRQKNPAFEVGTTEAGRQELRRPCGGPAARILPSPRRRAQ
jgi:hypothetical protein